MLRRVSRRAMIPENRGRRPGTRTQSRSHSPNGLFGPLSYSRGRE